MNLSPAPLWTRARVLQFIHNDVGLEALWAHVREAIGGEIGHDAEHALRVALWTVTLGGEQVVAREGIAAGLLHDIVPVPKNSELRSQASTLSAERANGLLKDKAFDKHARMRICDAIRDHSYSRGATPTSPLGQVLQDADRRVVLRKPTGAEA